MLSHDVERYIGLHRALGFQFRTQALMLRSFARHAALRGETFVRGETALAWAAGAPSPTQRGNRLRVVRRFARQMAVEDARHEIPPDAAFGPPRPRPRPHIFTPAEIDRLLGAAAALPPRGSLRPRTYVTLLALVASTGMRISEALSLRLADVRPAGLLVCQTKFHKSRLVPLHETARRGLDRYLAERATIKSADPVVFLSLRARALGYAAVNKAFRGLLRSAGLDREAGQRRPRIHDLRHTFAVRSLEQCSGGRDAVLRHVLALSTYLGHGDSAYTYWYLQATPHLLADIAAASEALAEGDEA